MCPLKKSATGCHRLLVEAYGNHTPTVQTVENWFRRFKSGDFDTENKECPGHPKKIEEEESKTLLDEDPCKTQDELAESLGVDS